MEVIGNDVVRAGTPQLDFGLLSGSKWFCLGTCECPPDEDGSIPPHASLRGATLELAVTGGASPGQGQITYHSMREFCKAKKPKRAVLAAGSGRHGRRTGPGSARTDGRLAPAGEHHERLVRLHRQGLPRGRQRRRLPLHDAHRRGEAAGPVHDPEQRLRDVREAEERTERTTPPSDATPRSWASPAPESPASRSSRRDASAWASAPWCATGSPWASTTWSAAESPGSRSSRGGAGWRADHGTPAPPRRARAGLSYPPRPWATSSTPGPSAAPA